MDAAHETLSTWWEKTGDHPSAAKPGEGEVAAIELRYGVTLPDDFRLYLLHSAPAKEHWDDHDAIWWSPERIKNLPEEYRHPVGDPHIEERARSCLFFADYMIWCWAWAICCDNSEDRGKVALIGGDPDRWIASSFTEFVERWINDPVFRATAP